MVTIYLLSQIKFKLLINRNLQDFILKQLKCIDNQKDMFHL